MRNVFNKDHLEESFHKDGYVTVELLNSEQVNTLRKIVSELNSKKKKSVIDSTYRLSYFTDDIEFKKNVFDTLYTFFKPLVDKVLDNYKPIIINIFDKEPGIGEVPVHQNWSFVDEDKYTSVSVWIPLVDVSHENGTLEVVKGSQKVLSKYRSPSIPWVFEDLYDVLRKKYLKPFEFKVGNAAIIDDGILHWSSDNKTKVVRTAVQLIMVPADAPVLHYHMKNQGVADILEVDKEFFMKFSNMKDIPTGYPKVGSVTILQKRINENELKNIVSQNNPEIMYY